MTTLDRTWPDTPLTPGEFLRTYLEMSEVDDMESVRNAPGMPQEALEALLDDRTGITSELAEALAKALDTPVYFWENMQSIHDEHLQVIAEREDAKADVPLLKAYPFKAARKLKWFRRQFGPEDKVRALREFFGVSTLRDVELAMPIRTRRNGAPGGYGYSPQSVAMWLRKGELVADAIAVGAFDRDGFLGALARIRGLTREVPDVFLPRIQELCAGAGVRFVALPALPKLGLTGVTRKPVGGPPCIQVNFRWDRLDVFWFTFFHEAAHVLAPSDDHVLYINGIEELAVDLEREAECDRYAGETFAPYADWMEIVAERPYTKEGIQRRADALGIHPGIIVGRLERSGKISYGSPLFELKSKASPQEEAALTG